ncbi:MAG TPA: DUF3667 domain-containing protein [Longimicrobiaceae bacterium]|nr:DUF3667 domain-containing protein [Longimicrobiaceae bacterium]
MARTPRTPRRLGIWKVRPHPPVVMDAVGARPTEGEPLAADEPCANCGDLTPGNFCRNCGQARRVVHVSLREMLTDFLDDQLALNSKLPITVAFLLLRPGFLTREYLRGRIASYIRPLRMYLGTSVMFFVVFAFLAQREGWGVNGSPLQINLNDDSAAVARPPGAHPGTAARPRRVLTHADSVRLQARADSVAKEVESQVDSAMVFHGMGPYGDTLNAKYRRVKHMGRVELQRAILAGVQDQGPRAMFLMLPIFAGILKLLYARSKRYYVEHFVLALHFHAFVFLLLTIYLGLQEIPGVSSGPIGPIFSVWTFVYLYIAMKKVYGEGWIRTGFKYWTLFWTYFITLTIAFIITTAAIFYFM